MKRPSITKSLATLIGLRGREVDRLTAEMAAKEIERGRYRENLARMARLCAGASGQQRAPADGPKSGTGSGASSAALSLNVAHYKQGVLQLAATHRTDLALHEADMSVTQGALNAASQRREVLGQVLKGEHRRLQRAQAQREQKQQDEQAAQLWLRGPVP